jgi:TolB-like protein/DNA-binding winged helix-turn-helix (wHTH) protein/Tfp pilus assembly protein PilF
MPAEIQAGKPCINLSRYDLTVGGQRVPLERQPMDLLIFFVQRHGQLVSREDIVEKLWGKDVFVDVDRSINAAVRKIRSALRDNPSEPKFLETVVGKGYRLVGEVEVVGAASPAAENSSGPVEPQSSISHGRNKLLRLILGFVVLGLLGTAAVWTAKSWQGRISSELPIHSIAVLPLVNLSGSPAEDYFTDGMTDELISDLAQISALRVISRTSVMQYKNFRKSVREIGKELNVDAVVEGTVSRSSGRVRINAQLIQAPTDTHLWARSYERDLGDVIALQDEVAAAIADEIRIQLLPSEKARLATSRAIKPEAYEAYLRGLYHIYKRNQTDLEQSTAYFQRAIELDPGYALAYAGLADSYALQGSLLYMVAAPQDVMPKSKSAAQRALQIDNNLGEAYATLAYVETLYDWDWAKSEEDFKRAIALKPSYAQAHLWYAMHLAAMGRHGDSIAEAKRAQALDPLSLITNTTVGLMLYFATDYDGAVEQFHKVLELDPDFFVARWQLGLVYEEKGRYEEARSEFQKAKALSPRNPSILESLGEVDALSGRRKEATEVLHQLEKLSKQEFAPPYVLASLNAALDDKDQAFEWLEKAYDGRDNNLIFLKADPSFRTMRSDSRFQNLLRRMGLSN